MIALHLLFHHWQISVCEQTCGDKMLDLYILYIPLNEKSKYDTHYILTHLWLSKDKKCESAHPTRGCNWPKNHLVCPQLICKRPCSYHQAVNPITHIGLHALYIYPRENYTHFKMSHSTFPVKALAMIDPLRPPVGTPRPVAIEILICNSATPESAGRHVLHKPNQ